MPAPVRYSIHKNRTHLSLASAKASLQLLKSRDGALPGYTCPPYSPKIFCFLHHMRSRISLIVTASCKGIKLSPTFCSPHHCPPILNGVRRPEETVQPLRRLHPRRLSSTPLDTSTPSGPDYPQPHRSIFSGWRPPASTKRTPLRLAEPDPGPNDRLHAAAQSALRCRRMRPSNQGIRQQQIPPGLHPGSVYPEKPLFSLFTRRALVPAALQSPAAYSAFLIPVQLHQIQSRNPDNFHEALSAVFSLTKDPDGSQTFGTYPASCQRPCG